MEDAMRVNRTRLSPRCQNYVMMNLCCGTATRYQPGVMFRLHYSIPVLSDG